MSHIVKAILGKKNKTGGIPLPDFKLYCKARVMRTVCHWHKNRHTNQWNRIESPEINPHVYDQLTFDNNATIGSKFGAGKTGYPHVEEWLWILYHTVLKINSMGKRLKHETETVKLLGENIGKKLFDISLDSNLFLIWSQKHRKQK